MKNWRKYNKALISNQPPHVEIDISDIGQKVHKGRVYFARWVTDFDSSKKTEFWYIINDTVMELDDYSKNTRSKIRRGLKHCDVRLVSRQEIIDNAYDSYYAAFMKYKTHLKCKDKTTFIRELYDLSDEWDFWGIYHKGILIGYSQNRVFSDCCDYSIIKFHPNFLKFYPSFALFYTMNKYYLNTKKLNYVNDGARSISHDTNIQDFLISKFKFRKAYCRMHICYHNRVNLLIKLIFPIRFILLKLNFGIFRKLNILILQEEILRSYE